MKLSLNLIGYYSTKITVGLIDRFSKKSNHY